MLRRSSPQRSRRASLLGAASLALALSTSSTKADNAVVPDLPQQLNIGAAGSSGLRGSLDRTLHLEVFINGRSTKTLIEVVPGADGAFSARRSELEEAGLKPLSGPADSMVRFDALPGLAYRYDEGQQAMYFEAPDALLKPHVYSPERRNETDEKATSDLGGVLNYDALVGTANWGEGRRITIGAGSLSLDGRVFSPFGVFSQSGVLGTTAWSLENALRLETGWQYADEGRLMIYRVGDLVNGGLAWTRPIRMGGFQVSHDLSLRPDLVTSPVANVSGSAAVPSSVDVYVNNFKVFTQDVDQGPYRIENLPIVGGNGTATLVTHDVNGKETTETVPFFTSPRLLAAGVFDYSAEGGLARNFYGQKSFSYDPNPIGSATLRGGVFEGVTLEGHAEGGAGLVNAGAGAVAEAFHRGVLEAAVAGSSYQGGRGLQISLGGETAIAGATIEVSSQRTFGAYGDLAEVTTPPNPQNVLAGLVQQAPGGGVFYSPLALSTSIAPPRALDRVSIGLPNVIRSASLNVSFINQVQAQGATSRIASVGMSRSFRNGASVFATGYVDVANRRDTGVFAGLSWTFDNMITASSQISEQGGSPAITTQLSKSSGQDVGATNWRIVDNEGANRYVEADGAYVTPAGKATFTAGQYGSRAASTAQGSADFAGSIATLGGAVKIAPTVADSLALVDAGAPGVTVLEDNRVIGKTDSSGRMVLTDLRGYQDNKISIDPTTLPVSAQAGITEINIRPRSRSGVIADFKVAESAHDAEIILTDDAGALLPPGGRVEIRGAEPAVVGYDGRAYLSGLSSHNVVLVRTNGKSCQAEFDYAPKQGAVHPTIGPVRCRSGPNAN